jgi:EmrB/QacA subfamily drug resistance transporter
MWAGLVAAAAGMFLTALDITVNVALPDITENLGTDLETIQWIIILYVGSTTGMGLGLGGTGDVYGLKRVYVIGLLAYTLAVFLIGIAPGLPLVLGLRVTQAVGNGLILVSAPAIVTQLFPAHRRGRALGIMAGLGTLGMIAGSLGGGLLVDSFGWRSIFLARVPLCLVAVAYTLVALRESPRPDVRPSFDLLGAAVLFVGMASLILFLTIGGRSGWSLPHVIALGLAAIVALAIFVRIERRVARPILDLSLLKDRVLAPALIVAYLVFVATFVNWFILPFYMSDVLNANAQTWGLVIMLMTITNAIFAPVGGWLSDRMHPSYTITTAVGISALTMALFTTLDVDSSVADVAILMMATGVGMGLFQASNSNLIMGAFPPDRLGMGGAIMSLSRSLGTVSSVAIMGAIFSARQSARGGAGDETQEFVLAFRDLYVLSALLALTAMVVSFSYWPRILRVLSRERQSV